MRDMINPTFVRTFLTVAKTQSFVKTARVLGMTQAGVTQHVQRVEAAYGAPVFSRERERHCLTDLGKTLVSYWTEVFRSHEDMLNGLQPDNPLKGECKIASTGSFGLMFHRFLMKLNRRHTELCFHFYDVPHVRILSGIADDEFDMGFVTQKVIDPRLVSEVIDREELLFLYSKRHRIKSVSALFELGFVDHPDGRYGLHRMTRQIAPEMEAQARTIKIRSFVNFIGNILDPVAEGLGFTVLPEHTHSVYRDKNVITYLKTEKRVIDEVYLVRRAGRKLPARFDLVINEFKKFRDQSARRLD